MMFENPKTPIKIEKKNPIVSFLDKKTEYLSRYISWRIELSQKESWIKKLSPIQMNAVFFKSLFEMVTKPLSDLKNEIEAPFQKKDIKKNKVIN